MNLEFRKTWSTVIHPILGRRQVQREGTGRYRISRFLSGTRAFLAERRRTVETDYGPVAAWDLLSRHKVRSAAIAACCRDAREREQTTRPARAGAPTDGTDRKKRAAKRSPCPVPSP